MEITNDEQLESEAFFEQLLVSDDPVYQHYGQRLIELVDFVGKNSSGPRLILGRLHNAAGVSLTPEVLRTDQHSHNRIESEFDLGVAVGFEPVPDYRCDNTRCVMVFAAYQSFKISYRVPEESSLLPWESSLTFVVQGHVQATIAIIHALSRIMRGVRDEVTLPCYINGAVEIQTRAIRRHVRCPHCDTFFSLNDVCAWDGKMHKVCKQKLRIVSR